MLLLSAIIGESLPYAISLLDRFYSNGDALKAKAVRAFRDEFGVSGSCRIDAPLSAPDLSMFN